MSKALRVLITGAARGIGLATAQVLANRGHWVVATDISAPDISTLSGLEGIQAHGRDALKRLVRSMQSSTTQAYPAEGWWKAIHWMVSDRCSRQTRLARFA